GASDARRAAMAGVMSEQDRRVKALAASRSSAAASSSSTPDLGELFSIGQQPAERRSIAANLGIRDAGHAHHGSNFDANQTRRQLINNLFAQVSSAQQD